MKHSETITKIAPALVKALNEIGGVAKGTTNTFFKSKYATLEAVIDSSKPILASHGIALIQFPGAFVSGSMSLETVLFHESGEWISGDEAFGVATGKQDPQAIGSALSYARRYAQMAVLNMPAVDDDGEAAMPRNAPKLASITSEQAETILTKLESTNSDKGRFLQYIGAPSISAIPANKYEAAINALDAKAK